MKTAVVRARVPEELKKDFETVAASHEMNLSHVIRMLMSQYVVQEKKRSADMRKPWKPLKILSVAGSSREKRL